MDVVDVNTGLVLKRYVPKELSAEEKAAARRPDFEPNEKIGVDIGFENRYLKPDEVVFRVRIPAESCPQELEGEIEHNGITSKVKHVC